MHAVILAAGIGLRLGQGERRPPKCLLSFDERTLLVTQPGGFLPTLAE